MRYVVAARAAGAYVVGLINTGGSPLGAAADREIALCAGPELAVVATKSVLMSVVAGVGTWPVFMATAHCWMRFAHCPRGSMRPGSATGLPLLQYCRAHVRYSSLRAERTWA